ncbi:hypothetical protein MUN89_15710 [Halobacillus salinarum]|uniref:Phage protein n=1 Tax=Halobacillus salinarum TaxID=2932257 RepID=A0ABY4EFX9_9BACI|nr:hypothetical protein [Halobacillus salinarum]UOQ43357.1 hypothetical protein MUN89_15710 [Halobacillus salinarum]
MKDIKVINKGKKTRFRLGVGFSPKEPVELTVSNREYLTVKAVKDFQVEVINPDSDKGSDISSTKTSDNPQNHTEEDFNLSDLTVDEVIKAVQEGKLDIDQAIADEMEGKNRSTLLDELEGMKAEA